MVLTILHTPGAGSPVPVPTLDIITVHGLNGDAVESWTNSITKAFWPKDFLPSDVPEARVMAFGYNSDAAFGNTTADIVDHAKDLLSSLIDKREEEEERQRPIIFIAHSLGGIVVKQALFLARIETQYSLICEHTIGIIFLGTPHRGSDKASYGKVLMNVATTVMRKPSSKLLSALKSNSDTLARLTSDFKHQLPQYQIVSFYERKPLGIFKKEIVEKHSALLETAGEDQVPVDANHRDMSRFARRDDENYEKLFKRVRRILKAKGNVKQSLGEFYNKHYLIPHNVSAVFTGRHDVCRKLQESCLSPRSFKMKRVFVLYGLGGSGKTQVSLKFAQDNRESFWGIFWIDSSNDQTIKQGFSKIAQSCQIEDDLPSILTWLSNLPQQWLLIFDNADDPSIDISRYFPAGSRGTILITTRNPECKAHQTVGSYEFSGMKDEDAVDLLLKAIGTDDTSSQASRLAAKNIVTTLGNLSLAIIQAGAVIRQNICRLEDYCDVYHHRRQELLSRSPTQASSDYKYTVYTTWEVSMDMMEGMSSEVASHALELLRLFSFFHFDGISEEVFKQAWENTIDEPCSEWKASYQVDWLNADVSEWDPYQFREAIALLSSFSLIQIDGLTNHVSIHPLVHTWARERLDTSERGKWSLAAALVLAASVPWGEETSDYDFRRSLISHVTTCMNLSTAEAFFIIGSGEEERIEIASKFIEVVKETGQWQRTMQLVEKLLEARKRILGDEHPSTLMSMSNLSVSYSTLDREEEAIKLNEEVLEARKRILGDEHPDTLRSMSNLAVSYSKLDREEEAVKLKEEVLKARKRILGDEHPNTLMSMSNLSVSYSKLDREEEAIKLNEEVLKARKRILGDEHPDTLTSMSNLAASYSNLSRDEEAVKLKEEVLEARKKILGDEHPDTLQSMSNLAVSYSKLDREEEAIKLDEEVLKARKRILGDEHPNTLQSMSNLAVSYSKLDREEEAIKLNEEVLEASKRILRDEHPDTLTSMSNLAASYSNLSRDEEAVKLKEEVLEARKKILGDEHPDTLQSMSNLAVSYSKLDREEEAIKLNEEVLEARKRILGDEHPDTLRSMSNLAVSYSKLDREEEAIQLQEKALEGRKKKLGDEHPDTLLSIEDLEIYRTKLKQRIDSPDLALHSVMRPEQQLDGNTRSRWSFKSWRKNFH